VINNFDLRSLHVFIITNAVGVKLFDRSVRPIILTSAGRVLLERGRQILRETKEALRETRALERRRLASLTIAMSDSMSALAHNVDIIIATSNVMEEVEGLSRHKVFQEPYLLIFPKGHMGSVKLEDGARDLPFLRFSMRSAMGLQIERQLSRLRLKFPDVAEFDKSSAHSLAVAKGFGWGITTPLCLLENPQILEHLDVRPIKRGAFSRHFDMYAREDDLGDIPQKIARQSREILQHHCLPALYDYVPWLEAQISRNQDETF